MDLDSIRLNTLELPEGETYLYQPESDPHYISGDTVTFSQTAAFEDKNAETGKDVNVTGISISGTDASNYTLQSTTATATADITPKDLTVSGIAASDKVYDGLTTSTVSTVSAQYDGLVSGDDLTVSATGEFSDKNAGTDKTVTLTGSYSGADFSNYTITDQASTTANITLKDLTITALDDSMTYTGAAYSGGNGVTVTGFADGEDISFLTGDLTYGGDSQGAVDPGTYGIILSGLSSGNYTIEFASGTLTIIRNTMGDTVFSSQLVPEVNSYLPGMNIDFKGMGSFELMDDYYAPWITGTW